MWISPSKNKDSVIIAADFLLGCNYNNLFITKPSDIAVARKGSDEFLLLACC